MLCKEDPEEEAAEKLPVNRRERRMAGNWTELLLGRLQQNGEMILLIYAVPSPDLSR